MKQVGAQNKIKNNTKRQEYTQIQIDFHRIKNPLAVTGFSGVVRNQKQQSLMKWKLNESYGNISHISKEWPYLYNLTEIYTENDFLEVGGIF